MPFNSIVSRSWKTCSSPAMSPSLALRARASDCRQGGGGICCSLQLRRQTRRDHQLLLLFSACAVRPALPTRCAQVVRDTFVSFKTECWLIIESNFWQPAARRGQGNCNSLTAYGKFVSHSATASQCTRRFSLSQNKLAHCRCSFSVCNPKKKVDVTTTR
jgi:hypothetical protein